MESTPIASPSTMRAEPDAKRRILALLPIPYSDAGGFWYREAGLIVATLRAMGHDAWLVALPGPDATTKEPVIQASMTELENPDWWKAQEPDAVISCMWGATRFAGVRRAALATVSSFIEKMDTDGNRSPRIWFREYFLTTWTLLYDSGRYAWFPPFAWLHAFAQSVILYVFPTILDRPTALGLAGLPAVCAESPIAAERIKRLIRWWSPSLPRIAVISHPVDERDLLPPPSVQRRNRIVSVGRWNAHQKNFPLLLRTLGTFLAQNADWDATIIGGLPTQMDKHRDSLPPEVRARITFTGAIPHAELPSHLYSARIFLMTSWHEGFPNSVSEALCCGCSVVGPVELASMSYFTDSDSGTISARRTAPFLCDAIAAEAWAWQEGGRDPERIASVWRGRVGAKAVVGRLLANLSLDRAQLPLTERVAILPAN